MSLMAICRNTYHRTTYLWVFNTDEALYSLCALSLDPQAIALGSLNYGVRRTAQSEDFSDRWLYQIFMYVWKKSHPQWGGVVKRVDITIKLHER